MTAIILLAVLVAEIGLAWAALVAEETVLVPEELTEELALVCLAA